MSEFIIDLLGPLEGWQGILWPHWRGGRVCCGHNGGVEGSIVDMSIIVKSPLCG